MWFTQDAHVNGRIMSPGLMVPLTHHGDLNVPAVDVADQVVMQLVLSCKILVDNRFF